MKREFSVHDGNLVLVNKTHPYLNLKDDRLVPLESSQVLMQHQAAVLLNEVMKQINGWSYIIPVSGWRSQQEQQDIWNLSLKENGETFTRQYVAIPGYSEHQTGLAIDLGLKSEHVDFIRPDFPYSGICKKFRTKAAQYGFIERYPKEKEQITGISHEPWHFRYVGIPHSEIMAEKNLTLEEYHDFLKQYGKPVPFQKFQVSYKRRQDMPESFCSNTLFSISGDNDTGFIVTEWRSGNA